MPRITYNSINIDVEVGQGSLKSISQQVFNQNRSGSGKIETISQYGIEVLTFDAYFDFDTYRALYGWWWTWARDGQKWSFAMDSSNTVDTTLDAAAASAQKVIPLTTTTGLTAGDYAIIKTAANDSRELVEIDTISAGISVTAVDNLVGSYASGDSLTHFEYYPSCINTKTDFDVVQAGTTYSYQFEFVEAL